MRKFALILLCSFSFLIFSCEKKKGTDLKNPPANNLSGDLVIFHAGSLSVPLKAIADSFKKVNPGVNILMEAAGSVESARKITELHKPCDVLASADYTVIDKLLIPRYAGWNIKFASNEMTIVYTGKSRRSGEIDAKNWYSILLENEVQIGRADPNSDPCGYRSVLVMKLAENFYHQKGLADRLLAKNTNNIRPKETDLIALLESGNVDYIFLYRSVAEQHKLKYILLPDEINLKKQELADQYKKVSVEIRGKSAGKFITQIGEPMVYGITISFDAPNKTVAVAFVKFLLTADKGMAILEKLGQPSVVPSSTVSYDNIPDELKPFARKP